MSTTCWILTIAAGLLALAAIFFFLLRRKRRARCIHRAGNTHPTGYLKYHEKSKTRLREAFQAAEGDESKAVAVLDFDGDIRAEERHALSRLIDEVLLNKDDFCEVVLRIESPGGGVAEYGHAYAEVARIPAAGLKLTVCIDTVAASGGYLMSLPATQILASPFAMVGSIGVVSFVPNVRKLLQKLNIEPRIFTAGKYKRTVNLFDDATPEEVEHYKQELRLVHEQFQAALLRHRPHVKVEDVATGQAWLAATSVDLKLGLVDGLRSASDYLLELNKKHDLVEFSEKEAAKSPLKRLMDWAGRVSMRHLLDAPAGP